MSVRDPASLTCKEVVELVTEFLDDAMSPEDRIRIEQHLLVCPPCTQHLEQVRSTIALTRQLGGDEPRPPPELMDVFRRWKGGAKR